ncbi:MAG: MopE-related protein, partial [Myxococcota bacterium]|nr:MopE-related protein [Myxococcota bacterium]
ASGATVLSDDADCADFGEADATAPATDCDDTDASINPGATEVVADGVDSDCDGAELCYSDADEDGYRPVSGATVGSTDDMDCNDAGEAVPSDPATDCDDTDAAINPGASEAIGDEVDSDCDGAEICFVDSDGDAYRAIDGTVTSSDDDCDDAGEAAATMATGDCDDADAAVNPGATEVVADGIDSDCDGAETCYADADLDGYADSAGTTVASADGDCSDGGEADSSVPQTDCDDTSASAYPGATEVTADGTDQDCDGEELCLVDADGDGHAEMTGLTQASSDLSCSAAGLALASQPADDCDDTAVGVFPGATESIADGIDQDCDTTELCYVDADGDGARSADGATVVSADLTCADAGEADGSASADCNDTDASVHPAAVETPADGIDSDCDGAELCYTDYDADGYRPDDPTPAVGDLACTGPGLVGAGAEAGDCDDADAAVNPSGIEVVAAGIDIDCNGTELCYLDADSDGYRPDGITTVESELLSCAGPGVATDDAPVGDCDDSSDAIHPDQDDAAGDEVDANCDGAELCFADGDGDGFRTLDTVSSVDTDCQDPGEATVDAELVDCDDTRSGVNPGAEEIAGDGIDQDCDGSDGGSAVADAGEKDGGGCATVPGRGGLGLVLLGGMGAVLLRRRRV